MREALFILVGGIACFVCGFFGGVDTITPDGLNACRAANPGYDCVIGYVRGEAFQ